MHVCNGEINCKNCSEVFTDSTSFNMHLILCNSKLLKPYLPVCFAHEPLKKRKRKKISSRKVTKRRQTLCPYCQKYYDVSEVEHLKSCKGELCYNCTHFLPTPGKKSLILCT